MTIITPPTKPVPDGQLNVYFHSDPSKSPMTFDHKDIVFTREEMAGLRVVIELDGRRHVYFFPWTNIFYDNMITSQEYIDKYREWMEFETVVAATEGRKPSFAEREVCSGCGTDAPTMSAEGSPN